MLGLRRLRGRCGGIVGLLTAPGRQVRAQSAE